MNKKEEIPCILYLYIHSKLSELTKSKEIKIKKLKAFMYEWKIPKKLRPLILKEFEMLGLTKRKDAFVTEIKNPKFDMNKVNKYYDKLGLFTN